MRQLSRSAIVITAFALIGCAGHMKSDDIGGRPSAQAKPTLVVKAYLQFSQARPKKVLRSLRQSYQAEDHLWPQSGVSAPVAVIESVLTIDPATDQDVCRKVKDVYEGAVIRKVGGIGPTFASPAAMHDITVSLPRPDAEDPGKTPDGTTRC